MWSKQRKRFSKAFIRETIHNVGLLREHIDIAIEEGMYERTVALLEMERCWAVDYIYTNSVLIFHL